MDAAIMMIADSHSFSLTRININAYKNGTIHGTMISQERYRPHFKDWLLPMEHFHYDTFRVRGVKEDTIFITMPMTYHYEELTGKLDGFSLKLEPEVDPVWFKKQ